MGPQAGLHPSLLAHLLALLCNSQGHRVLPQCVVCAGQLPLCEAVEEGSKLADPGLGVPRQCLQRCGGGWVVFCVWGGGLWHLYVENGAPP